MKNAGIPISNFLKSIDEIFSNIDTPISISTGATAAIGTHSIIGYKSIDSKKNRETNTEVKPVLPPASIPAVLSKYVVALLVPRSAPIIVPAESATIARSKLRGIFPFLSILNIPAFLPVPINIPIVSNKSDIVIVNIVIKRINIPLLIVSKPVKSNLNSVGVISGINLKVEKSGNLVTPSGIPIIVLNSIPFKYAAFFFLTSNIAVNTSPSTDTNTAGFNKFDN